jgi:hypothetical protein
VPPSEEIKTLHIKSPERIIHEEIKENWITQNPNRSLDDFYYKEQPWRAERKSLLEDFSIRWQAESSHLPELRKFDQKIGAAVEPINDPVGLLRYRHLMEWFDTSPFAGKYAVPQDAQPAWRQLLGDTHEQVQRNGGSLATVIKTTRTIAGDEVFRQAKDEAIARKRATNDPKIDPDQEGAAARKEWEDSWHHGMLDNLEQLLSSWDKMLAEKAFPDPEGMKALMDQFGRMVSEFSTNHVLVYAAAGAPPFVKYQLLATMRSLSEKVASQFAARIGNPSFSAAYSLISEVPRSGNYQVCRVNAENFPLMYPSSNSGACWDLQKGFSKQREQFLEQMKSLDKPARTRLKTEFDKLNQAFEAQLKKWRKAYDAVGSDNSSAASGALADLYQSTAELARGFGIYKQVVDDILKDSTVPLVQNARKSYQYTLDGFMMAMTDGILISQNLVVS